MICNYNVVSGITCKKRATVKQKQSKWNNLIVPPLLATEPSDCKQKSSHVFACTICIDMAQQIVFNHAFFILFIPFRQLILVSSYCFALCAWQQHMLDVLSSLWCCTQVTHYSVSFYMKCLSPCVEGLCASMLSSHSCSGIFTYLHLIHFFAFLGFWTLLSSFWSILSTVEQDRLALSKYWFALFVHFGATSSKMGRRPAILFSYLGFFEQTFATMSKIGQNPAI